ncbi:DUF2911 domain-containing protein [uncultured Maribacter sp.]|uniref:DUF2911 domain-containing protein n=1 Tax=uncultured Maribacter sp. TaxID=431308 RepID=UPI002605AD3C|nr:DUF2911 domain-containing protein [uncultured Maribacter sp.]
MKKLKWLLIILASIALLMKFVAMPYMQEQTKKHSPEKVASYHKNNKDLKVTYSSPSKKGRVLFGELIPFNQVWRTGANEPTSFITETDIKIIDKNLPAGIYSLWTIPNKDHWDIIFNSEMPEWGVTILSGGKETTRNPEMDVVNVQVPVTNIPQTIEQFTIDFEEQNNLALSLSWDTTKVNIPIK